MRFFADECVDMRLVRALRADGHEVLEPARGASDISVLAEASKAGCILLTADSDFGALLVRDGLSASGVICFRSDDVSRCLAAVRDHVDDAEGAILVVTDTGVRTRPLSPGAL